MAAKPEPDEPGTFVRGDGSTEWLRDNRPREEWARNKFIESLVKSLFQDAKRRR